MLAATLPNCQTNYLLALDEVWLELDVHIDMAQVLLQCPTRTCYGNEARLDGEGNAIRDLELFSGKDVAHLVK